MAERRTRKKAEPAPEPEAVEQGQAEPTPKRKGPAFPFPEGHYLSTPSTSLRGHSEGASVSVVQTVVDLQPTGVYDAETADAVGRWQAENDLPRTRVVDAATWDAMMS